MSTIEEIKKEIIERHQAAGPQPDTPAAPEPPKEKPKPVKREKTKAEIEAYRQKMMEKEEARYLGKVASGIIKRKKTSQQNPKAENKPVQKAKPKAKSKAKSKAPRKVQKVQKAEKAEKVVKAPKMPKILKPLVPLYLLRIPGLPKGDCIAICYAEGAYA